MTKREAILREIARELATRDIDAIDLRKITVVVHVKQGGGTPRTVISNLEYGRETDDPAAKKKLPEEREATVV